MTLRHLLCIITFALLTAANHAEAMLHDRTDTVIGLVTCHPGTEVYELEGHSAIHIQMPGTDVAVSYGLYNFSEPNFVFRFVKGETDYMAGAVPWQLFLQEYEFGGRRVDEQVLNLTSEQKARLIDMVVENLAPENCRYRYNYVKDNCATRPLSLIERAVAPDSLTLTPARTQATTFREVMRSFHRDYPWYQFGIDLALGQGIDYRLSNREYAFAPVLLQQQISTATAGGKPIVLEQKTLVQGTDASAHRPTPWFLTPMAVCWTVFALLAVATAVDIRRRRTTRWIDAVYFGAIGLTGLVSAFLIFVSVHEATSPNWLFLWINPLALLVPIFIWLKNGKNVVFSYQIVNFALIILLCAAWAWLPQSTNPAFWPLILADMMRSASYIFLNLKKSK